ncbi:MAG TPA: metalloregulator ArsR/SmtB family transcription factor [Oculatellaceae cyanobacterium]
MSSLDLAQRARMFNALSDPTRLQIVELLSAQDELCGKELAEALSITLALLCHHTNVLVDAGVLSKRKQGQFSYYSLNRNALAACINSLCKDA